MLKEIKMTGLEFKFKDLHEKIYHKEDLKPRTGMKLKILLKFRDYMFMYKIPSSENNECLI